MSTSTRESSFIVPARPLLPSKYFAAAIRECLTISPGRPRKTVQLSKNVSRGLTYVLIVVIIVVGAQLIVGSALGSSPVYVVVSKSMVPTLEIGDLVIAQSVPFSSIHVGQVIIYVQPDCWRDCRMRGLTIVHRVVAITSQGLITQGDDRATNPLPDEP